ncbi:MAG: HEPN domain-containing protein [Elusimicrobia bacterium]|nr:HEPN domain-containing protein [Candidatus Obscuribacterium magneticum]
MKSSAEEKSFTNAVEVWLTFAHDDARAAKNLFSAEIWNLVCFHAQQATEKALKAFLRMHMDQIPRVHSLAKLTELCSKIDRTFLRHKQIALLLDRFYIPTRYPEAAPGSLPEGLPGRDDAKVAIQHMKRVLKHVSKRLAGYGKTPLGF